jgi:dienelactone hydrolase
MQNSRPKNSTSNRTLLVCSDIFGITPALQTFFTGWRDELLWLSPYRQQHYFSDDQAAYHYFQQQGGLDSYRHKLRQTFYQLAVQQQQKHVIAVGFSAGAAALWCELASELGRGLGSALRHKQEIVAAPELKGKSANEPPTNGFSFHTSALVQQAFCFYGGQIRHFAALSPSCPTTLIWAQERHFDVEALAGVVAEKHHVSSHLCRYHHGFINPYSNAYHKQGAAYYQRWLMTKLLDCKAS